MKSQATLNEAAKAQAAILMIVSSVHCFATAADINRCDRTKEAAIADGWTEKEIESAAYRVLS